MHLLGAGGLLFLEKPTRVAAPSPRASLGRRTVCGRTEQRRPPVSKRYETKVRMEWESFLIAIAAAALKTPTRNGYNAQGVNLTFCVSFISYNSRHNSIARSRETGGWSCCTCSFSRGGDCLGCFTYIAFGHLFDDPPVESFEVHFLATD